MLTQLINRCSVVVKEEGLLGALGKLSPIVKRVFRRSNQDVFDAALNVETSAEIPLWRLPIASPNAKFGTHYQTTAPSVFLDAIGMVPGDRRNFTFVDLGSGKGRTLILAAKHGFKRVVGVEFSPDLAAIARKNVEQLEILAEIVVMDASHFRFPDDNLVIYMYNPFGRSVVSSVVDNIIQWHAQSGKFAFVVYVNPTCYSAFDYFQEFRPVVNEGSVRVWCIGSILESKPQGTGA